MAASGQRPLTAKERAIKASEPQRPRTASRVISTSSNIGGSTASLLKSRIESKLSIYHPDSPVPLPKNPKYNSVTSKIDMGKTSVDKRDSFNPMGMGMGIGGQDGERGEKKGFHYFWDCLAKQKADGSPFIECTVPIPETVLFKNGIPSKWLYNEPLDTGSAGRIINRKGDNSAREIYRVISRRPLSRRKNHYKIVMLQRSGEGVHVQGTFVFDNEFRQVAQTDSFNLTTCCIQEYIQCKGGMGTAYLQNYELKDGDKAVMSLTKTYNSEIVKNVQIRHTVALREASQGPESEIPQLPPSVDVKLPETRCRPNKQLEGFTHQIVRLVEIMKDVRVVKLQLEYVIDEKGRPFMTHCPLLRTERKDAPRIPVIAPTIDPPTDDVMCEGDFCTYSVKDNFEELINNTLKKKRKQEMYQTKQLHLPILRSKNARHYMMYRSIYLAQQEKLTPKQWETAEEPRNFNAYIFGEQTVDYTAIPMICFTHVLPPNMSMAVYYRRVRVCNNCHSIYLRIDDARKEAIQQMLEMPPEDRDPLYAEITKKQIDLDNALLTDEQKRKLDILEKMVEKDFDAISTDSEEDDEEDKFFREFVLPACTNQITKTKKEVTKEEKKRQIKKERMPTAVERGEKACGSSKHWAQKEKKKPSEWLEEVWRTSDQARKVVDYLEKSNSYASLLNARSNVELFTPERMKDGGQDAKKSTAKPGDSRSNAMNAAYAAIFGDGDGAGDTESRESPGVDSRGPSPDQMPDEIFDSEAAVEKSISFRAIGDVSDESVGSDVSDPVQLLKQAFEKEKETSKLPKKMMASSSQSSDFNLNLSERHKQFTRQASGVMMPVTEKKKKLKKKFWIPPEKKDTLEKEMTDSRKVHDFFMNNFLDDTEKIVVFLDRIGIDRKHEVRRELRKKTAIQNKMNRLEMRSEQMKKVMLRRKRRQSMEAELGNVWNEKAHQEYKKTHVSILGLLHNTAGE